MRTKNKRFGVVVRIPFDEGLHTYGMVLKNSFFAVFDCKTSSDLTTLEEISESPILFILVPYDWPIRKKRWKKVGELPVLAEITPLPKQYIQEIGFPEQCLIVDEHYNKTPATVDECEGLEKVAVWDAEHVEERIRDHYAGRENRQLKRDRLALEAAKRKS